MNGLPYYEFSVYATGYRLVIEGYAPPYRSMKSWQMALSWKSL